MRRALKLVSQGAVVLQPKQKCTVLISWQILHFEQIYIYLLVGWFIGWL